MLKEIVQERALLLHNLRNPYGRSAEKMREDRLAAADIIEEQDRDYQKLLEWAKAEGLNITTYG